MSNSLEGYRIPSSAVHSLNALSKTLTGPTELGPVKPGGIVMERPHHGALDLSSHPHTVTEAAGSRTHGHRNTIQMCCMAVHAHALHTKSKRLHQQMQMKTFPVLRLSCMSVYLSVSRVWNISIIEGEFTQIPQPCQPMTGSPRGPLGFSSKGH